MEGWWFNPQTKKSEKSEKSTPFQKETVKHCDTRGNRIPFQTEITKTRDKERKEGWWIKP
jgi:hypothetical protein